MKLPKFLIQPSLLIFLVGLFFLFKFPSFFEKNVSQHNVIDCIIFDMNGVLLWSAPGGACVFFSDGHFAMGQGISFAMFDAKLKKRWSLPFQIHHQVNKVDDDILILAYDYVHIDKNFYRTDTLVVANKNGKIKKQFFVKDHLKLILTKPEDNKRKNSFETWLIEEENTTPAKEEITHFNSFYQIPENPVSTQIPAFAQGNYIANELIAKKAYILSYDLKKILWQINFKDILGDGGYTHDVQILESGKILIYSNRSLNPNLFSTIDLYDPLSNKVETLFKDSPPQLFFSKSKGGVQILPNGNLLVSDITSSLNVFEVSLSPKPQKVWSLDLKKVDSNIKILNRIRRYDLTDFLKNNKGL